MEHRLWVADGSSFEEICIVSIPLDMHIADQRFDYFIRRLFLTTNDRLQAGSRRRLARSKALFGGLELLRDPWIIDMLDSPPANQDVVSLIGCLSQNLNE